MIAREHAREFPAAGAAAVDEVLAHWQAAHSPVLLVGVEVRRFDLEWKSPI
jgi:hypothetical protein